MAKQTIKLYEDVEQDPVQVLFAKEEKIQDMCDVMAAQVMKERIRQSKKKKRISDTAKQTLTIQKDVVDVLEGTPANTENPAEQEPPKQPETKADKKPTRKEDKKPSKKQGEKKFNPMKLIIAVFIILLIGGVGISFRNEIAELVNKWTMTSNGFLPSVKGDDIAATLEHGSKANEAFTYYYASIKANPENVSLLLSMVQKDKEKLNQAEQVYASKIGGKKYYDSIVARYDNLNVMLKELKDATGDKTTEIINNYIRHDNQLSKGEKEALKNYLDVNKIPWSEKDGKIYYEVKS